jgi:hypothetical protein
MKNGAYGASEWQLSTGPDALSVIAADNARAALPPFRRIAYYC